MGCLAGVEASDQAAVELQVSFAPLLSLRYADGGAAGPYLVRTYELLGSALVDRVRLNDGDTKLTSRLWTQEFDIKSNQIV